MTTPATFHTLPVVPRTVRLPLRLGRLRGALLVELGDRAERRRGEGSRAVSMQEASDRAERHRTEALRSRMGTL